MRHRFGHVLWIGGGSGAGKSTVARRLAAEHGLLVYSTDDAMGRHAAALSAEQAPYLARFLAMTMDERWLDRSPRRMLDTFPWFRGEGFDLIVADLARMADDGPVVVEGFRLLPHLVGPHLTGPRRAVWLLPTPAFRRAAFDARGTTWQIPGRTTDAPAALERLLARDALFTEHLAAETRRLGLPVVDVDVGTTPGDLVARVAAVLGLSP